MPRKPRAEAPSRPITFTISPDERLRLRRAAVRNGQSVSAFLRDAAAEAAADCLEDQEWREPGTRPRPVTSK